jgi:coenzyme Q-binding protein COQ10
LPHETIERVLPYGCDLLIGIVMDVGRYPDFLKWVRSARVRRKGNDQIDADLLIGHKLFTAPVSANLVRCDNGRIEIRYLRGPVRDFSSTWLIQPVQGRETDAPYTEPPDTDVEGSRGVASRVRVTVDIKPGLIQAPIINGLFDRGMVRLVEAFEARAHALHGSEHGWNGGPEGTGQVDAAVRSSN